MAKTADNSDYFVVRHPLHADLGLTRCYLCNTDLASSSTSSDHIIPDRLFTSASPSRPQLLVHDACHKKKSRDDRHFIRMLQMMSGFNPDAEADFGELVHKATEEGKNAWIVGKSKEIPNYKFVKTLTQGIVWDLDITSNGNTYHRMKISKDNHERFSAYSAQMCRALFIRNVPGSFPSLPRIDTVQYTKAELIGDGKIVYESAQKLMKNSTATAFAQMWGDRISYFGSATTENINHGYLYIHFYRQYGILASFTK